MTHPIRTMSHKLRPEQRVLAESDNLIVFHEWEHAAILFKETAEVIDVGDFYGNPCCAAIGPDESWVVIGGDLLALWKAGTVVILEGIHWVHDIRATSRTTAAFLIDPWCEKSAVWKIDVISERTEKLKDFMKYREEPYTDDVEW